MQLNTLTYIIYSLIMAFIIIYVGWRFYINGEHYLHEIFSDAIMVRFINRLLLIGYYLVNLGYVAVTLNNWPTIKSYLQLLEAISTKAGFIILSLGILHYFNMLWIRILKLYYKTT
tara:strand:+ start:32163 stop:32510 length:348 start_codon:yes stop_codon:yes gene_type:complete